MEDSAPRRMEKPSQRPTFRSSAGRSRRACRGCRLAFLLHYFGCLDLSLFSLILNFLFICLPSVCLLAFSGETSGVFLVRFVLLCAVLSRHIACGYAQVLVAHLAMGDAAGGGTVRPSQVVGTAHGKCLYCWRRIPDGSSQGAGW